MQVDQGKEHEKFPESPGRPSISELELDLVICQEDRADSYPGGETRLGLPDPSYPQAKDPTQELR